MPKLKTTGTIHDTVTGYDFTVDEPLGRKAAVRHKCLECQCGASAEVRRCQITDCTLWPWRMGAPFHRKSSAEDTFEPLTPS